MSDRVQGLWAMVATQISIVFERLGVQSPGPTRRWERGGALCVSARARPRLYKVTALARSPNLQDPHTATFVLARGPGAASYTRLVRSSLIGHIKRGDLIAVRKAISEGADLYEEDSQCWTPLFHAAYRGDIAILQLLIDGGADVNHGAFSALHWAAMGGHLEVVKELLRAGATIPAETLACRNYLSAEMRALLRCENSPA